MNNNNKPLTLEELIKYNQEVFLPALENHFATKKEFNGLKIEFNNLKLEFNDLRDEFYEFKNEFKEFKEASLRNQDAILKKIDILIQEKTVIDYQKKKERKMFEIIIGALEKKNILNNKQIKEIEKLGIL
ncbi:MAG: hypothetical protein GWO87_02910 [Xanthomonadaceae bacterium]|nr:hypothetical protein [Rhodospirillaceae bacterium]NIA18112.1 hypothetical protein [Xanthomonadaceae bacterium]